MLPARRPLAWDLHCLAHALARAEPEGEVARLYSAWWAAGRQRPSERARLGGELLLAAREQYADAAPSV